MGMTPAEERAFDQRFIQDYDNLGPGPLWLFRVNPDGTRSIALPQDVKDFISQLLDARAPTVQVHASDSVGGKERG